MHTRAIISRFRACAVAARPILGVSARTVFPGHPTRSNSNSERAVNVHKAVPTPEENRRRSNARPALPAPVLERQVQIRDPICPSIQPTAQHEELTRFRTFLELIAAQNRL